MGNEGTDAAFVDDTEAQLRNIFPLRAMSNYSLVLVKKN